MPISSSSSTAAVQSAADARRTRILVSLGYLVVRYWNNDVMQNIEGVIEDIAATLESHRAEPLPQQDEQDHL
jgi:very-short-patch-repair endonuclease